MPSPKQMDKMAAEAARRPAVPAAAAPDAPLSAEYWEAVLKDPRAVSNDGQLRQRQLSVARDPVLPLQDAE